MLQKTNFAAGKQDNIVPQVNIFASRTQMLRPKMCMFPSLARVSHCFVCRTVCEM